MSDREDSARLLAADLRRDGGYRWVGIYEVTADEIGVIAWDGEGEPAFPRFPRAEGLCGAAVASRSPLVVGDVSADSRYLTTFGSTRSELVVPVVGTGGDVVGVVDVESDRPHAFGDDDLARVERAAAEAAAVLARG